MKGWKSAERSIEPSVAWDQAGVILRNHGFTERVNNPQHVVFEREGTQFAIDGKKILLNCSFPEQSRVYTCSYATTPFVCLIREI